LFRKNLIFLFTILLLGCCALGRTQAQKNSPTPEAKAASDLAGSMAQRLSNNLHIKTVVGEPIKVGAVTLIPILMIEVNFGGGIMSSPPGPTTAQQGPAPAADAFFMSGAARPLGFVAITKKGTRFISVAKQGAK
jgi:uncharacterized spore protein YtfJ